MQKISYLLTTQSLYIVTINTTSHLTNRVPSTGWTSLSLFCRRAWVLLYRRIQGLFSGWYEAQRRIGKLCSLPSASHIANNGKAFRPQMRSTHFRQIKSKNLAAGKVFETTFVVYFTKLASKLRMIHGERVIVITTLKAKHLIKHRKCTTCSNSVRSAWLLFHRCLSTLWIDWRFGNTYFVTVLLGRGALSIVYSRWIFRPYYNTKITDS